MNLRFKFKRVNSNKTKEHQYQKMQIIEAVGKVGDFEHHIY